MFRDNIRKKYREKIGALFTKSNWHLLVELVRANLKVYDHNCVIGILWSLLGPVMLLAIMYSVFKMHFGKEIYAYPLYLLIGIIFVNFFSTVTNYMVDIFSKNRRLVVNTTVTREIFVGSVFFIHMYKFVIELVICCVLSVIYDIFSWKALLLLLPLFAACMAFVFGVCLILSMLFCYAQDVKHLWILLSRLVFFATPIFYSIDSVPSVYRGIIWWCNPLVPFLLSFQDIFLRSGDINMMTYTYSLVLGGVFIVLGYGTLVICEDTALEEV